MISARAAAAIGAFFLHAFFAVIANPAWAMDKVHLGKAQAAAWAFIPTDVGIEEGIFAKYGIDVDIVDLAGDAKVQQALAANSIEFGLGSGPGMAFTAKGSPAIGVAAFAGEPRNISAIVLVNSPIKTVTDLKGKLIAVSTAGSLTDWLTKQMARQEGWGQDGVKTIALGAIDASVAALKAHQVDAIVLATEIGYQLEGFFASIAFMRANRDKTSAIAVSVLRQSPAVAAKSYDYGMPMLSTDGVFDPQAVEVLKQSFADMGTLDHKPRNDELFTSQFVPVKP
jgi:NitT/TauT family transport system substrate-binding protein